MTTTDPMPQPLIVFSQDKYVLIDDYHQKILGKPRSIGLTWPELRKWNMDKDLDATYQDEASNLLVFFKGDECAIYKIGEKSWVHGKITQYYDVPDDFASGLNGATIGGAADQGVEGNLFLLKGTNYVQGVASDPTKTKPKLSGPTPISAAGWNPIPPHAKLVGAEDIFPPNSAANGTKQPISTLVLDDDDKYECWFYPQYSGKIVTLNDLWPGYEALNMTPVNAVMRVDTSAVGPVPSPGPGPVIPTNPLCEDLPTIMKSICSLTLLMHKVVDACYPQSSWPTEPYPDGCSSGGCGCKGRSGHKHSDCGCKRKPS